MEVEALFPSPLPLEMEPKREAEGEEELRESQPDAPPPPPPPMEEEQRLVDMHQQKEISEPIQADPDTRAQECTSIPEQTSSQDHLQNPDQEQTTTSPQEMDDVSRIIQTLDEDVPIPEVLLEGTKHSSSLYALGTKFNIMMKNYKEKYDTIMNKYTQECSERKRLYNELIEMKGNIRVFCRCRPLSSDELSKGCTSTFVFDPLQERELQIIGADNSRKNFKFDHVFGPQDNQEVVFAETLPIVRSVLDGFNACIFAYGQTGTGKTFTMEGTEDNRGVNYRTLEELFRISAERSSTMRYEFFVSMLEVYNEKIRDLLVESSNQQGKKLEIKQAAEGTQEVAGLIEAQAYETDEVWKLLRSGKQNRAVGSTNANELSSRSHCLLRVTVKGDNLVNGQRSKSHLWLVDLAGSERVGKTEVEGERLKESQFINKSLSALGDVISGLASRNSHIPYRNSKLTHLLQSSLGGGCKTLMFVQISPSSTDLGETLCSLNFATRVRGIEQGQARKQPDVTESFKYKQMEEKLRQEAKENAKLNENLQLMHLKYASRESVIKSLHEKVRDLETQLVDERRSRLQQENKDSTKLHRPPLPPIKERPPLGKITNYLPPSGLRRHSSMTIASHSLKNKENIFNTSKMANGPPSRPPMKAQRVSLAPKRRVSIATIPSQSSVKLLREERNSQQNSSNIQGSFLKFPRRRSILSFSLLPQAPVPATPDAKGRISSFASSSSSKYFSPPQLQQASWRSKIPTFGSPRQRLRPLSSPAAPGGIKNTPAQTASKLCFSVQKRLVISSPAAQIQRPVLPGAAAVNQALREKEIVGRTGGAQRVLCKNRRRMSVM